MNVVKNSEQPSCCPVCGKHGSTASACNSKCQRTDLRTFMDVTTLGDVEVAHVHVRCNNCGFTYLTEPFAAGELARLL